jgi:hypothetical protein
MEFSNNRPANEKNKISPGVPASLAHAGVA